MWTVQKRPFYPDGLLNAVVCGLGDEASVKLTYKVGLTQPPL